MSTADRQQAHYFDELLGSLRFELGERIEGLCAQVLRRNHMGDHAGVSRARRTIRALEEDVRAVDRMRDALRLRLDIPNLGARPTTGPQRQIFAAGTCSGGDATAPAR
jgi:hypothetical protein